MMTSGSPQDPPWRPRPMSRSSALRQAKAIFRNSEVLQAVAAALTPTTGRPAVIPWGAFLVSLIWHAIIEPKNLHRTKIADNLASLRPSDLRELGIRSSISCAQVQRRAKQFERRAQQGIRIADTAEPQKERTMRLDDLTCEIVLASVPASVARSTTIAIDGTDFPTSARHKEHVDPATGEVRPSIDPDAALAHRTATSTHDGEWYVGFEAQISTMVPALPATRRGYAPVIPLAMGVVLKPGTHRRAEAARHLALDLHRRSRVTECIVDRGLSFSRLETFHLPLIRAKIRRVHDLHPSQVRWRSSSVEGVLLVNGTPMPVGTPQALYRDLPVAHFTDTPARKGQIHDQYDRLAPFACRPLGGVQPDGRQRFRGPAHPHVRKVRCVNWPQSLRWDRRLPITQCTKGQQCKCGATFTLRAEDDLRERQDEVWGSNRWYASYSRRVGIESIHAAARIHHGDLNRGYTHVLGLAGNAIAYAFGLVGVNARMLYAWHDARGLPTPWDLDAPDNGPRLRRANRNKPRRWQLGAPQVSPPPLE